MMTFLKKNLALLLAVVLCLGLTACGGSDDIVDDTVGDDWRSSGVVVASGTITHEGEGSVHVLVTVDENSAAFYRDEPEQILFDSVSFPMTIPDAQEYFNDISFDDIDGDGESDVSLGFVYAPGDSTSLVWIWDPEERYVFREDLSVLTTNSGDISQYAGLWEYVDEDVWIRIYEDETWEAIDAQGNVFQSGTLSVDSTGITFYRDDSDESLHLDRTVSGDLIDSESGGLIVPADSIPSNNGVDLSEYVGLWEYVGENLWLCIYDDETWSFFNDQEDVIASGTLAADEFGVTLYFDGTGDVMQLDRAVSGDLLDVENNGMLVPASKIESRVPYFTRYGLEINAAMDMGTFLLEDGVCSYANLGENYSTGDCYWEVIKNYDQTHDGIREIQFDAICYIPQSSLGTFYKEFMYSTDSELYDFYTGKWFTTASTYGSSNRGENYYVHTIDWNGQSQTIEFAFSTNWESNVGDWAHVLTKSYVVYLPEGYDGLVFSAEPKPDNYKDYEKKRQLDSISPEASIMDIDLLDPYGCLFFSICY